MSTHKGYALIAILAMAALVGVVPAFASNNPYLACPDCNDTSTNIQKTPTVPMTVTTDKSVYDHNSTIMVSGHILHPQTGQDISVEISNPDGSIVFADQAKANINGDFSIKASTKSNLWFENGQYAIKVQQGDEQSRSSSAVFDLTGEAASVTQPAIPEFGPIAALVLAIAIISIIALSAKTGLRLMPRY